MRGPQNFVAIAAALAALGFVGCGGDGDGGDQATVSDESAQTFVAVPEGGDEIVAITVEGESLSAYVCDGFGVGEFFEGSLEGDRVALRSERGARFEAEVRADSIVGTFSLGKARTVRFTAEPKAEAGIYLVNVSQDGGFNGEGAGAASIRGEFTAEGLRGSGTYADGTTFPLDLDVVSDHPPHVASLVRAGAATTAGNKVLYFEQGTKGVGEPGEVPGEPVTGTPPEVARKVAGEQRVLVVDGLALGRTTKSTGTVSFVWICID